LLVSAGDGCPSRSHRVIEAREGQRTIAMHSSRAEHLGPPPTESTRPGFSSFKTSAPVHYRHRWHRDALIQLTLDPAITQIDPAPLPGCDVSEGITALVAHRGPVAMLVGLADRPVVVPADPVSDLPFVALTRREVLAEPRATTARMIWSARTTQVSPGDRLRVLQRLSEHPEGLPIAALESAITSPHHEPFDAILALACIGLVAIDATGHLVPETVVRRIDRCASATPSRADPPTGLALHAATNGHA